MISHQLELVGAALFGIAVLHTFSAVVFHRMAVKLPEGSVLQNLLELLGEVEIVFGLWAGVVLLIMALIAGGENAIAYAESLNFTEPLFVFAIMTVCATAPVAAVARMLIMSVAGVIARVLPVSRELAGYFVSLTLGPLLGSLVTEPAAMATTAYLLRDGYFSERSSRRFKYVTLSVLFVNVSIGGVLTNFAAPPVLMVAGVWGWDSMHMLKFFGWKAVLAILVNAFAASMFLAREIRTMTSAEQIAALRERAAPLWLMGVHLVFVAMIVLTAHHPVIFIGLLLFFLGVTAITREYQEELRLRESLLVAFFLGGLVILGGFQRWWLEPVIRSLDAFPLFLGATALTAITDNAALTYLGSLVPNVSEGFKYALVAGAVAGGGLSVIANAPNPAGYTILRDSFGPEGVNPLRLAVTGIWPTLVAMSCLWLL